MRQVNSSIIIFITYIKQIIVADTQNNRIQIFDAEGQFIRQFGTEGSCELIQSQSLKVDYINDLFKRSSFLYFSLKWWVKTTIYN